MHVQRAIRTDSSPHRMMHCVPITPEPLFIHNQPQRRVPLFFLYSTRRPTSSFSSLEGYIPLCPIFLPHAFHPKHKKTTSTIEMLASDGMTVAMAMQGFTGLDRPEREALAKLHMHWGANARNWMVLKGYTIPGTNGKPGILSLLNDHWNAMSKIMHSPVEGLLLAVEVYTKLLDREWDEGANGILEEKLWTPIKNADNPETHIGDLEAPTYSHSTYEAAQPSLGSGLSDLHPDATLNTGEPIDAAGGPALTAATQSSHSMEQPSVPAAGLKDPSRARGMVIRARAWLPEVPRSLRGLSYFTSVKSGSGAESTTPTRNGHASQN
jgi:hypothetical protein